ncbi:MAG: triphosphoribosyl-dephospho-CoA synthase [Methanosarcinaceae archaeon]|nr:triphosphoribosyl-dephospho-CoA synthase [Methanosarcinaceae archaeon]
MIKENIHSYIAKCAQLAMVLEVSAHPKPGNVDRTDDYKDTKYEHFLASSISIYDVIKDASQNDRFIGKSINNAVDLSTSWQNGGNTHFGAFILLIPIAMASGNLIKREELFSIKEFQRGVLIKDILLNAHEIVKKTDIGDAIEFYKAFTSIKVKVNTVKEFDLKQSDSIISLSEKNMSLYDLMEISKGYDMIANEWVNGFNKCAECAKIIIDGMGQMGIFKKYNLNINEVIVYTFLFILANNRDTFIQTKFDIETADFVSNQALNIITKLHENKFDFDSTYPSIQKFDDELLFKKINPGSTADIVIAGLFIALMKGIRF